MPTDMLREVLLRLPADELCRPRLVCRSWGCLTSDPLFAKEHSSHHDRYVIALHVGHREIHVLDLYGTIVMGMENSQLDLAAVSSASRPAHVFHLRTGAGDVTSGHGAWMMCPPKYTLGYVPSTQEYKMLCFVHSYGENFGGFVQPCHVMTLGERSNGSMGFLANGNCCGGMAYFLVSQEHAAANIEMDSIALFDLVTEEWRPAKNTQWTANKPPHYGQNLLHSEDTNRFHLSRLSGCLVVVHQNGHDSRTDIWFLDDIEMSLWTRRYTALAVNWLHLSRSSSSG
ncbi:hypothetical protein SETIT_3G341200v2 [Setaria italica]|uniref:F-box domain-containing protein n=1 Tax=Setaria italica TaxID=4555 RepID=A0A368QLY3_SETIT|nr:hypothetical protein SETIT_3G341200v2 [Setaria italica]